MDKSLKNIKESVDITKDSYVVMGGGVNNDELVKVKYKYLAAVDVETNRKFTDQEIRNLYSKLLDLPMYLSHDEFVNIFQEEVYSFITEIQIADGVADKMLARLLTSNYDWLEQYFPYFNFIYEDLNKAEEMLPGGGILM